MSILSRLNIAFVLCIVLAAAIAGIADDPSIFQTAMVFSFALRLMAGLVNAAMAGFGETSRVSG